MSEEPNNEIKQETEQTKKYKVFWLKCIICKNETTTTNEGFKKDGLCKTCRESEKGKDYLREKHIKGKQLLW